MIHEVVMNMGHDDNLTEIYSVDAQYSVDGGVIVMVTGCVQSAKVCFKISLHSTT